MALIIEDGTGVQSANAYQSAADCTALLADYGYSAFAGLATEALKETALIRGTLSVDTSRIRAARVLDPLNDNQGLFYPQAYVLEKDTVPIVALTDRVPEMMILACALKAEYIALTDLVTGGADVAAAKLDPLVTEVEYANGVRVRRQPGESTSLVTRRLTSLIRSCLDRLIAIEEPGLAIL